MTVLRGQTRRDSGDTSNMMLPPKVEIRVERLEGILWSTPVRPANRDELKKRVPFVTAAVEFSGTCPNMKVYSASKFPHSKHPAVESYFAALEDPKENQQSQGGSEVKKKQITSTTTQEIGGQTTTTTTTTITTVLSTVTPVVKYKEGHYPLVAKWHDDSSDEKLIDSVTYFTNPATSYGDGETGTALTQGQKANRPHLTLTLPTAAAQRSPSLCAAPWHNDPRTWKQNPISYKNSKDIIPTQTHSTCASTTCSSGARDPPKNQKQQQQQEVPFQSLSQEANSSTSPFHELGSLLDQDDDEEEKPDDGQEQNRSPVTRQDEADVIPVIASQKSKELTVAAIAAEPSSAIVGQSDSNKASRAFTPLSWITCGTAAPEIVELRVRVMPEDWDEFDELDPSKQHLAAAQDLEGVAHLVFLDQIIEEGTTVMDLPLKRSQDKFPRSVDTVLSTTPTVGEQEFVTLGANAMLRVRVTILPQGRRQPPVQSPHRHDVFNPPSVQQNSTMKTQYLPDYGLPFYSRPFSLNLKSKVAPLMERMRQFQYFQSASKKPTKTSTPTAEEHEKESEPKRRGPFPHEFPTVVPDDKTKTVESPLLGNWKPNEGSWSLLGFSSLAKQGASGAGTSHEINTRRKGNLRRDKNKQFYTIPDPEDAPQSYSTDSDFSEELEYYDDHSMVTERLV